MRTERLLAVAVLGAGLSGLLGGELWRAGKCRAERRGGGGSGYHDGDGCGGWRERTGCGAADDESVAGQERYKAMGGGGDRHTRSR